MSIKGNLKNTIMCYPRNRFTCNDCEVLRRDTCSKKSGQSRVADGCIALIAFAPHVSSTSLAHLRQGQRRALSPCRSAHTISIHALTSERDAERTSRSDSNKGQVESYLLHMG